MLYEYLKNSKNLNSLAEVILSVSYDDYLFGKNGEKIEKQTIEIPK